MKILITHAYTKENKGDAAILSVLLMQARLAFPQAQIKVSTFEDSNKNKNFDGYETISSYMYLAVYTYKKFLQKLLYACYIVASTLLWATILRYFNFDSKFLLIQPIREIAEEFQQADLIIPIGGGYLRAKPNIMESVNLTLLLHPILLSLLLRKPVVLYSQSIGPFFNLYQRTLTRLILNRTKLILAREDHTINTLKQIGVKQDRIIRTVDAGFLFEPKRVLSLSQVIPSEKLQNKLLVGITVRKWLAKEKQKTYEKSIARFIDNATKNNNLLFIFIPQVSSAFHKDDDRVVAGRIMQYIKNKNQAINLETDYTHRQIKSLYSDLDYVIGTRFHSIIFSLTSYVPALAIEYEYKTGGIMKDLGLGEWVIPIEQVTTKFLMEKFQELIEKRESYLQTLHATIAPYQKQAGENVVYIKKAYNNYYIQNTGYSVYYI